MKVQVITRGTTEFDADPEHVEAPLRAAITSFNAGEAAAGYVAAAFMGCTSFHGFTDDRRHITVTEDDGTVLWSGWLTGDPEKPAPGALEARLLAAEQVCVLFGWTGAHLDSDREKALHELWREWTEISGVSHLPEDHPELSDERIAELARRRDETRARTLATLHGEDGTESADAIAAIAPEPGDETPGYWQVRAALTSALNALQQVALGTDDKLAAMAMAAVAGAEEILDDEPDEGEHALCSTFPIYARFAHPGNGYKGSQEQAAKHLTPGRTYLIDHMDVGRSCTTIWLHGIPGEGFNSVLFAAGTFEDWERDEDETEARS